jgi:HAD superfamily hydrolase (TIGR01509 family)
MTVAMSQYEAVLFDMDGVTVETATVWRELERTEILPAAVDGPVPFDEVRALSVTDAYDRLASLDDVDLTVSAEEFDDLYDRHARAVYHDRATLLEEYETVLADLRAAGHATGLVSASRRGWVEMVLDRFGLTDAYDVVVSATDFEGPSKPDPTTYLLAAETIETEPEACLVVEDSPHGIESAVAAGMSCLALRGAGNADEDLSAADEVVSSGAELRTAMAERGLFED